MLGTVMMAEYTAAAIITLYIVWGWKRGPNYWPAGRLLALSVGVRAVYMGSLQWQTRGDEHGAFAEVVASPWGNLAITSFILFLALWALYLVLRTNRLGREVDVLGREAEGEA